MRRVRNFIEKQGFFVLLAVCVLVIAGSGIWAYTLRDAEENMPADAASDYTQRLADAERMRISRPMAGNTIRGYAEAIWLDTLACFGAHQAIDIAATKGTDVLAARDGTVTAAYRDGQWGGVVEIEHANGMKTIYKGLSWPVSVKLQEKISALQKIGKVGALPVEASDGAHLHFELLADGSPVDPARHIMD